MSNRNNGENTFDAATSAQSQDLEVQVILTRELQERLAAARPRLLRLARLQGVPASMVEDVVQESLFAAWHSLNHLHQPDRFDAWLDSICRNISRQQRHVDQLQNQQQVPLASIACSKSSEVDNNEVPDILVSQTFDPADELDRQDMQTLLDRALGYLTPRTREAIELYYLLEVSQREAALQLGLSIRGLEDRLSRARQHLRQVLSGKLSEDAQAFGLAFNADDTRGWRESRVWCVLCGRRRLRGLFEPLPDGTYGLRLRCDECSVRYSTDIFSVEKITLARGMRSFHPACKQIVLAEKTYFAHALKRGWQSCRQCESRVPLKISQSEENLSPLPEPIWVVLPCSVCGSVAVSSVTSIGCWTDPVTAPVAQRFMIEHSRWIAEPPVLVTYEGQPAIRIRLADFVSAAGLTIFVQAQTLHTLSCFHE